MDNGIGNRFADCCFDVVDFLQRGVKLGCKTRCHSAGKALIGRAAGKLQYGIIVQFHLMYCLLIPLQRG